MDAAGAGRALGRATSALGRLCTGGTERVVGALREAAVLARLTVTLAGHLAAAPGKRWVLMALRLAVFSLLLLPGFVQVAFWYLFSRNVRRGVRYSPHPRNSADVYLPRRAPERKGRGGAPPAPAPAVVFVTGGAWIIGHRAWGALLGRTLSALGLVVACLDYRNFPQGGVLDMVEDVEAGLEWVLSNVHLYGGDPRNVHVVGQSAGAHLVALTLLRRAATANGRAKELGGLGAGRKDRARIGWEPGDLRTFIGLSGGYHLPVVAEHLHRRGLYKPLFDAIMSGGRLEEFSPALLVAREPFLADGLAGCRSRGAQETTPRSPSPRLRWEDIGSSSSRGDSPWTPLGVSPWTPKSAKGALKGARGTPTPVPSPSPCVQCLPRVLLLHGTADKSMPCSQSLEFAEALRQAGALVEVTLYSGETHTTPLIENPMRGGVDQLTQDIWRVLAGAGGSGEAAPPRGLPLPQGLVPEALASLATFVSPF